MNVARKFAELNGRASRGWTKVSPRFLPFADAATAELPLGRLLRPIIALIKLTQVVDKVLGERLNLILNFINSNRIDS